MNEFEYKTVAERSHTTYRKNINLEKCAGLGLNGFIPKKLIQISKKKILRAVMTLPAE